MFWFPGLFRSTRLAVLGIAPSAGLFWLAMMRPQPSSAAAANSVFARRSGLHPRARCDEGKVLLGILLAMIEERQMQAGLRVDKQTSRFSGASRRERSSSTSFRCRVWLVPYRDIRAASINSIAAAVWP
jgi:hypothetical protein